MCTKVVLPAVPNLQHRPILLRVTTVANPKGTHFQRKYNFRKSKWDFFNKGLESYLTFDPVVETYEKFIECVHRASNRNIPRGCRTKHIPGLDHSAKDLIAYNRNYNLDPFSEKTVELGQELLQSIGSSRQQQWVEMIDSIDMKHSSRMASKKPVDSTETRQSTEDKLKSLQIRLQVVSLPMASLRVTKSDSRDTQVISVSAVCRPFELNELEESAKELKMGKI